MNPESNARARQLTQMLLQPEVGKEQVIQAWWNACCRNKVRPLPGTFQQMIEEILDAEFPPGDALAEP